jgi:hypothetical protein
MGLAMVHLFLLTSDLFTAGKAQLCEAMAGAEVLLVAAVYVLLSLRGRFPVYFQNKSLPSPALELIERSMSLTNPSISQFHSAAQWHVSGSKPGRNATSVSCR